GRHPDPAPGGRGGAGTPALPAAPRGRRHRPGAGPGMTAPLLGAHMSIAGGLAQALDRGRDLGCSAVQIFLKNQRQWVSRPLSTTDVSDWRRARRGSGITSAFAHASYLVNLG